LLQSNHEVEKRLFVLITSDRGLAGGYHQQLFNAFLQETKELAKESIVLLTIGRKGFFFGRKHQYQMVNEEHISNRDQISGTNYAMYVEIIEKMFLNKQIKDITLVYNHFVNALKQEVKFETLLPVSFTDDEFSMAEEHDYLYEGHPNDIFENMILIYLQSRIYGVMVDAKLAEFSSRIVAMKQATDNSNDVLEKLELQYNQARQHKITADLLDISNGKIGN
jgi:F-type H+-transporting ATPase subunit gamma